MEVLKAGIEEASLCALAEANAAAVVSDTCLPGGIVIDSSMADSPCTGR